MSTRGRPRLRRAADSFLIFLLLLYWYMDFYEYVDEVDGTSGATAAAIFSLAARHRHPVIVFMIEFTYAYLVKIPPELMFVEDPDGLAEFCLVLTLYEVARRCSSKVSMFALTACPIASSILGRLTFNIYYDNSWYTFIDYLERYSTAVIPFGVVWIFGYSRRQSVQAREAESAAAAVRRAERQQTGRELHDVVSHTVAAMLLQAAGARAVLPDQPERARVALDRVQDAGVQTMAELRRMLGVLRLNTDTDSKNHTFVRKYFSGPLPRAIDVPLISVAFYVDFRWWISEINDPITRWVFVVLDAAVVLTLVARWRWPVEVFLIQILYAVTFVHMVLDSVYLVGVLIALYSLAAGGSRTASIPAAVVCAGYFMVHTSDQEIADFPVDPIVLVPSSGGAAAIWVLGFWMRQANQARAAREQHEQARRDERLRAARDLHDIVSHTVTVMLMQAAGARAVLTRDPERARQTLDTVQEAGVRAMGELRQMLEVMRLDADDADGAGGDSLHQPGLDQLEVLVDGMRDTGLTISVRVDGTPARLDRSVDVTAYRVVQEALTNTTKHGTPGCAVAVVLDWRSDGLRITITDHGGEKRRRRRIVIPSTGNGLIGLRERVTAIGGELSAEPGADGFVVTATLPITTAAENHAA